MKVNTMILVPGHQSESKKINKNHFYCLPNVQEVEAMSRELICYRDSETAFLAKNSKIIIRVIIILCPLCEYLLVIETDMKLDNEYYEAGEPKQLKDSPRLTKIAARGPKGLASAMELKQESYAIPKMRIALWWCALMN